MIRIPVIPPGDMMKTEQILKRPFLDGVVRQNHKTKLFRVNDLEGTFPDRPLRNWARFRETKLFVREIMEREHLTLDQVVQTNRSKNPDSGGTWVHPLLLLDYAMYVSVEFKYKALVWLHDNLCQFRDYAGDSFKDMNAACRDVLEYRRPYQYMRECMMVSDVAGIEVGTRNTASAMELKLLDLLQKANAKLIRAGVTDAADRQRRLIEFKQLVL